MKMIFTKQRSLNADAKVGDVFMFNYGRNASEGETRRVGRVLTVRDLDKHPLLAESYRQNQIDRSRFLITLAESNGQIRKFYAEDIAASAVRLTWLGKLVARVQGIRFPAAA
jgi:hypothetical protein